jgi:phosphoserine phosphatase
METYSIAVFDVCGTITKTNNTSGFIGFVLARGSLFRYGLFLLIRILSSFFSFLGIRSIFGRDRLRDWQIALLRGCSRTRIDEMSERYVNDLFRKGLLNGAVLEAMKREKEAGRGVFLISAAVDPPVVAIARKLDVQDCFSSELEIEDGRCTGRLRTDLLGDKESILARIPGNVDWRDSAVYSDNVEDSDFMEGFGRRNVILNTSQARRMWDARKEGFHFIVNYDESASGKDIGSVNESVVKWTYIPSLYYMISRFHREGVFTLLVREIIPVTLAAYLFANLGAFSFVLLPLSFLMFYSVYEIGGLVNDLAAKREAPGRGTCRISPHVHIRTGLFVAIRVAVVGLVLVLLPVGAHPLLLYAGALCLCLGVYLTHTLVWGHLRILTFVLLKLCRNSIPLLILASYIPFPALAWLCTIFFVIDAPWRVYAYLRGTGLVRAEIPVWRVRCVNVAVLCGWGTVTYLISGSLYLLAIAWYYVVLECLWIVRRARSLEAGWFSRQSL